jgi:hypothetical protein
MKKFLFAALAVLAFSMSNAQQSAPVTKPDPAKKTQVVEASCGECQFKMPGKGCHLAVRMDGKSYFVDCTSIDEHGDAHGKDGFCEAIRKAEVQGEVVKDRFRVTYFRLLPVEKKD